MKKFKIYIFDFDGTLINSYECIQHFYQYCFNPFNIKISKEESYKFAKISFGDVFSTYIKDKSLFDQFQKRAFEVVESGQLLEYTDCFPETLEVLNLIKDNNITAVLVTGNDIEHVRKVFKHLKLPDIFKFKICYRDIKEQKPSPEGILKALDKLNYKGNYLDVCYVGDSINDFLAAKNAGVTPILVDRFNDFSNTPDCIKILDLIELFK